MDRIALTKASDLPEMMTPYQVANYLDVGYGKALRLIRFGGIPYLKLNNTYRVPKDKFFMWLDSEAAKEVRV